MKAIKVADKKPVLVDAPPPKSEGINAKVIPSSICGSDRHLMAWPKHLLPRPIGLPT